jgi:hypothetical protein
MEDELKRKKLKLPQAQLKKSTLIGCNIILKILESLANPKVGFG